MTYLVHKIREVWKDSSLKVTFCGKPFQLAYVSTLLQKARAFGRASYVRKLICVTNYSKGVYVWHNHVACNSYLDSLSMWNNVSSYCPLLARILSPHSKEAGEEGLTAFSIRDALFSAHEPVYAYVGARAYSAAALITLAANRIVMAPGASIGAAEPIPATVKLISGLRGEFESTAERSHRNPKIAGAMVDKERGAAAIQALRRDPHPEHRRRGARAAIAESTAPRP